MRQIKRLPANIRFAGIPAADEVRELEEGEPKKLPPWIRLARMTFELARLPEARQPERLNERQWYRPGYAVGDPGDMSCP